MDSSAFESLNSGDTLVNKFTGEKVVVSEKVAFTVIGWKTEDGSTVIFPEHYDLVSSS